MKRPSPVPPQSSFQATSFTRPQGRPPAAAKRRLAGDPDRDLFHIDRETASVVGRRAGQEAFLKHIHVGRPVSILVGSELVTVIKHEPD